MASLSWVVEFCLFWFNVRQFLVKTCLCSTFRYYATGKTLTYLRYAFRSLQMSHKTHNAGHKPSHLVCSLNELLVDNYWINTATLLNSKYFIWRSARSAFDKHCCRVRHEFLHYIAITRAISLLFYVRCPTQIPVLRWPMMMFTLDRITAVPTETHIWGKNFTSKT
jgi:hypothetical protein